MPKTAIELLLHDMVKTDKVVFEIVRVGTFKAPPPPQIISCLKYPGSDQVKHYR